MQAQDPIFVHALWRTGSTYLWGKFRTRDELCCFFEPLHESLIAKSREDLKRDFARASKKFSHDTIDKNYYDEFELTPEGGVKKFQSRFVMDRYSLGSNEEDPELNNYLQSLISKASNNNQRAVLQFNRSILRAKWMKHNFGGAHAYLNRNLNDIYESYTEKKYYLPSYIGIIRQNAKHPIFAEIADHLGLKSYEYRGEFTRDSVVHSAKRFKARQLSCTRIASRLTDQDKRDIAAFFWASGLASATGYADMIIDTDRIIEGKGRSMPEMFSDVSGLEVDFSDLKIKTRGLGTMTVSPQMKKIIRNAVEKIGPDWKQLHSTEIAEQTRVQFDRALA